MSIRTRAYSILAAIAVLMAALALGSVWTAGLSQTLVNRLYGNALLPSLDLKTVSDGYTNAGIVTAVRVRTGDLSWDEGEQTVRKARERIVPAWADYHSRIEGGSTAELVREAETRMAEADAALDELADILAGQDVAGLATYIARVMYPSINPLLSVIERLTDQQDHAGQAIFEASNRAIGEQRGWLAGLLVVADDSGLEVDCLEGAPGVRSARYAEDQGLAADAAPTLDERNNAALLRALDGVGEERRQARYRCVLALARDGAIVATAEGAVEGRMLAVPRGERGFGYDPLFFLPDLGRTMAELDPATRLSLSHRGRALRRLLESFSEA